MTEPEALLWVMHTALGEERALPDATAWTSSLPALASSRLSALARHLLGSRADSLPIEARHHLEAATLEAECVSARASRQLEALSPHLEATGLPWVVLKSWPLAARLYPTPSCRPSSDLDLLVAFQHHASFARALSLHGYHPENSDNGFHTRYLGPRSDWGRDVVELHREAGPPEFGGPGVAEVLASRRRFSGECGAVWVPSIALERDLLIRHYLRHGGNQAILLLDLLLHLRGEGLTHPLGALVGNDLARLGFERQVNGPRPWRQQMLARWMASRDFETRRAARVISPAGLPLALARSHR
ncbi:MAG: nucleotidyltransferase family protein, partial [Gemmatimonadota bacterium]